jgi:hypothetical protein
MSDDILNQYINDETGGDNSNNGETFKNYDQNDLASSGDYVNLQVSTLPLGRFYKNGIKIKIRSATVAEVQAFSVVDDKNYIDVTEKLNQLLASCVKVTFADGSVGSYKDLKDGDRLYITMMIRELTFQKGPSLSKNVECPHCSHEFSIVYRTTSNTQYPKTIEAYKYPEKLEKYYKDNFKAYEFEIDNAKYKLAPPNIGLNESFITDLRKKAEQNQKIPKVSQMKLLQFMLYDKSYISPEGIKKKEDEVKRMDMKPFQILNTAVDKMKLGIKGLKQECPNCGQEVHSDITFPNGISNIFVIPDFFDEFDRQ